MNFFLADVQTGVGPFLAIYLAGHGWNEQRVGIALTVGGLAGIVTQTPAGWLVDHLRAKRALIAIGVAVLAASALLIAMSTAFAAVVSAQLMIGGVSSVFVPAICAISLGLVGHELFDSRQGRNQAFNSAGNVCAAVAVGLLGYYISNRSVFLFVAVLALPTLLTLIAIRPSEIDFARARGGARGSGASLLALVRDRTLLTFMIAAVLFHFANAAMLPLLGERLAKGQGRSSMLFMSACVITTQVVIALTASWWSHRASHWGRRPLLLIAFGVMPVRAVLYTLTDQTALLVAIQILDGLAGSIFAVVSVLVVADRTRGTGRFNLALGALATAVGIGASLSQVTAGALAHHAGMHVAFFVLAAIAALAFAIILFAMKETAVHRLQSDRA